MNPTSIEIIGAILFGIALVHTFSTKFFERLAHTRPAHAGTWHFLGEVEVVFGFWAMILVIVMLIIEGKDAATTYLNGQSFTEPMFVFAIMVVAGSRPILQFAMLCVKTIAQRISWSEGKAFYFVTLSFVPLLGSLITEPAAMTLAGLILLQRYYSKEISTQLKYVTLGVLFVNISIGGTMTSFAAPPVLMVAGKWGWDNTFMLTTFGWKAALAVLVNALAATLLFQHELSKMKNEEDAPRVKVPFLVVLIHLVFLIGVVVFAHHPVVFIGLLLFFIGFTHAYERYQDPLILREGLMVGFFLAGLVVLGGYQKWWLQPLLTDMDNTTLYFGATLLTAFTDNAALTYLGSLLEGTSAEFRYALVAGAVTGGGLTVIANAPNPAGFSILKGSFKDGAIHPLGLLVAALPPTFVAILAFQLL
ncbi:putative Na+/H+ antiporter [Nitrosospira sp. Nsp5]|uniref:Na+/H+ antiporter n=1 Tax=Nitrosospira multiformis TaxID=1231 RepID=A0ABY0TL55_9PROT|nr:MULTISPECIES: putative Na+/H+ antiporter [Nitrosospira]PTR09964.1 putative Na+/H+ antiporter [Nitrosospira sp. Nsp5]SDR00313.1 Putative Na+/H+ antiporter [Nitrosospira multiformis]